MHVLTSVQATEQPNNKNKSTHHTKQMRVNCPNLSREEWVNCQGFVDQQHTTQCDETRVDATQGEAQHDR
jgi:hypothetical protein